MIAGGDEDGAAGLAQGPGQGLGGLGVGVGAVEEVPGEEDQVGPPRPGQLGQAAGQLPQLRAALPGLLGAQAGEGGVQMEVGPVEDVQQGWLLSVSQVSGAPLSMR